MATNSAHKWYRLSLDFLLLLTLVLVIFTYGLPSKAKAGPETQPGPVITDNTWDLRLPDASLGSAPTAGEVENSVNLDNQTLAAVIAVENVALTPLQYMVELPIIIR